MPAVPKSSIPVVGRAGYLTVGEVANRRCFPTVALTPYSRLVGPPATNQSMDRLTSLLFIKNRMRSIREARSAERFTAPNEGRRGTEA
jgi:hypothetical protein